MRKEHTHTTKLGIFVTAAVALFTIAVYYIGNQQSLFGSKFRLITVFSNVRGLQPGNNVRYSGIDVGIVDQIEIVNDSTIRVEMLLEKKVQAYIKNNAVAKIGTDGLVGNMIVNIDPGKGQGTAIKGGEVIPSFSRIETDDMINALGSTTENITLLTFKLLEITEAIQRGEGAMASLLNDPHLSENLSHTLFNLRRTSGHVEALSGQFRQDINQMSQGDGALGFLLRDTLFGTQLNQLTNDLDTFLLQRTQPILTQLEMASKDIALTSASLRNLTEQLDLEEGLAGAILHDSLAAESFRQILYNLDEGTYRFNENMEAMKHNFLFRKYFKKQEKQRKKELRDQDVRDSSKLGNFEQRGDIGKKFKFIIDLNG